MTPTEVVQAAAAGRRRAQALPGRRRRPRLPAAPCATRSPDRRSCRSAESTRRRAAAYLTGAARRRRRRLAPARRRRPTAAATTAARARRAFLDVVRRRPARDRRRTAVLGTDRLELGEGIRWTDGRAVLTDILTGRLLAAPDDPAAPLELIARLPVPLGAVAPSRAAPATGSRPRAPASAVSTPAGRAGLDRPPRGRRPGADADERRRRRPARPFLGRQHGLRRHRRTPARSTAWTATAASPGC